jgi:hypothetical protein
MSNPLHSKPKAKSSEDVTRQSNRKSLGGRPPKFSGPSRPVTLTLPESTLDGLKQIHADRGQAIVKLTEAALRGGAASSSHVEIVTMADNTGLLVVGPSEVLRRIPFLHLVEVAPARFVMAMDPGNDFRVLELALRDALEDVPESNARERELVSQLLEQISVLRKSARVRMAEILFVELGRKGKGNLKSVLSALGSLLGSLA